MADTMEEDALTLGPRLAVQAIMELIAVTHKKQDLISLPDASKRMALLQLQAAGEPGQARVGAVVDHIDQEAVVSENN